MESTDQGVSASTFDPKDVSEDATDGKQSIISRLEQFAQYLQKKQPPVKSTSIPSPFVFEALTPLRSADFGISDELVGSNGDGVLVIVPHYATMKVNDSVSLFWDGKQVAFEKILSGQENGFVVLNVAGVDVPQGIKQLYCQVTPKGGSAIKSQPVTTLVRYGQPGTVADAVDTSTLPPPKVAPEVIDGGAAKAKVKVTIPTYPAMNPHDLIQLYWGNKLIEHSVSAEEVGKPIVIEVDEQTIQAAGDSDQLPVSYRVVDEVGNKSELSASNCVKVVLNSTQALAPPVIVPLANQEPPITELDLVELEGNDLQLRVDGDLRVGDNVVLHWVGTTEQGQEVKVELGPQTVTNAGEVCTFTVAFQYLANLGQGSALAYYVVSRGGVDLSSKRTYVDFIGNAGALTAPILAEADDLWIEATEKPVHVIIPITANLHEGDEVTVHWRQTKADGSVLVQVGEMKRISSRHVGKAFPIRYQGHNCIKPFDGGYVEISYVVKNKANATFISESIIVSVGYLVETLAPPVPDPELSNDILDPTQDDFTYGTEITIPHSEVLVGPYTITLYWVASNGQNFEDVQTVQAGERPSTFQVPREYLELDGAAVDVTIHYIVRFDDERPDQASQDYDFQIAEDSTQIPNVSVEQTVMSLAGFIKPVWNTGNQWVTLAWPVLTTDNSYRRKRVPSSGIGPFTYSSNNPAVASVASDGTVTGRNTGWAIITIKDAQGHSTSYWVNVTGGFSFYMHNGSYKPHTPESLRGYIAGSPKIAALTPALWNKVKARYGHPSELRTNHWWTGEFLTLGGHNRNGVLRNSGDIDYGAQGHNGWTTYACWVIYDV